MRPCCVVSPFPPATATSSPTASTNRSTKPTRASTSPPLFKTDDGFRLGRLDTDEACEAAIQVFRQLVREATTGNRRTSDLAYHLIDLQDAAIAPRGGKNTAPWCSNASG